MPQALGEMLDSVQAESAQAEGEISSSAPAEPTPLAQPAPPALVKKERLSAALAFLENTDPGQPEERSAHPAPTAPLAGAILVAQKVNSGPLPDASNSPAEHTDSRPASPEIAPREPRPSAANQGKTTVALPLPLAEDLPDAPAQSTVPVTGRLFESPVHLMAALVADEEREIMSARFQYAAGKAEPHTEPTPRTPAMNTHSDEQKPGTSLLSLTQKLLKRVSDDRPLLASVPSEQRHSMAEHAENVEGKSLFWPRRDKRPVPPASEEWNEERGIGDKNDQRTGPGWHPFAPSAADSPEQASAGLLAAVLVSVLATVLVVILLVLNL